MAIVKSSLADAKAALASHDWSKFDATTDEDIAHQIAADPDTAPDMAARLAEESRSAVDMAALRSRLGMTQAEFARAYRLTVGAVRAIERGERRPSGPTATLLELISKDPEFVKKTLAGH
jgi:putative transcriptional regulator